MKHTLITVSLILLSLVLSAQSNVDTSPVQFEATNANGEMMVINTVDCSIRFWQSDNQTTCPDEIAIATRMEVFKDQVVAYGIASDDEGEYEIAFAILCKTKKCRKAQDPVIYCGECPSGVLRYSPIER